MLNDPVLGMLPASEADLIEAYPKVHPDALIGRIRRLERAGAIRKDSLGRYRIYERPEDEPFHPPKRPRKRKPGNRTMGIRHCRYCKAVIKEESYGSSATPICPTCHAKATKYRASIKKSRVCLKCGVEKSPLRRNFKKVHVRKDGKQTTGYSMVCFSCETR